jgi:hypothetical protein
MGEERPVTTRLTEREISERGLRARREREILERVRLAGEELDQVAGGRLGYLVAFVHEDPARWFPEQAALHHYRLMACATEVFVEGELLSLGSDPLRWRAWGTVARVRRVHRTLRAWFQGLVTTPGRLRSVAVPTIGLKMQLFRMTGPGVKPARFVIARTGPLETVLLQRAAEWIRQTDRLVACRECGMPCLALRKRLFCSPPCLQAHHDRKKIEKRKREKKGGSG